MSNNNNNHSTTSSSHGSDEESYEEDGECFFADRTLDLEDAHALATPISVSGKTSKDAFDITAANEFDDGVHLLQNARLVGDDSARMRSISSVASPMRVSSMNSYVGAGQGSSVMHSMVSRSSTADVDGLGQRPPNDLASLQEVLEERVNAKFGSSEQRAPGMNRIVSMEVVSNGLECNSRRPTMPRDTAWGITAVLFVPLSLLLPFYVAKNHSDDGIIESTWEEAARSSQGQHITFWGGLVSFAVAVVLW